MIGRWPWLVDDGLRHRGFALLQVLRHHHAHGVTQTDFRQQIIKRGELHTLDFTLHVLFRDLCQLAAATQRVVEQTTAQAYRVVAFEVLQQLADLRAGLSS
ncbi:Uncharacterised protein [Leclercia adecarboxylata]|uniref:Uncharacterized protein n=1 Tax=Leclercia adecarboxylata TaxID=83655 RepID=A0A4U9HDJ9_9ENTR|nr:Uncharacterised protein [Leclercia adecarboxylata]